MKIGIMLRIVTPTIQRIFFVFVVVLANSCSSTNEAKTSKAKTGMTSPFDVQLRERAPVDPMQDLASYTIARKISMYYRLDLKRDNFWSKSLAATFRDHDGRMRSCYTDRLHAQPTLKGALTFTFRLEKGRKTVRDMKRIGGTINDSHLAECLRQRTTEIPVNPPHNMNGLITWEFSVLDGVAQVK